TQSERLLALAEGVELWHGPDQTAYASVNVNGHRENLKLRAGGFRGWLGRLYYQETGRAGGDQAMQDAIGVLEARAGYDGRQHGVSPGVGKQAGGIYRALGDPPGGAVEIGSEGGRVVSDPPCRFRRSKHMHPLPVPESADDNLIKLLKPHVN